MNTGMKNIFLVGVASGLLALSAHAEDAPKGPSADELWQSIQTAEHEALPDDRALALEQIGGLRNLLKQFEGRYPNDPRHWDAKLARMQMETVLAAAGNHEPDNAAL